MQPLSAMLLFQCLGSFLLSLSAWKKIVAAFYRELNPIVCMKHGLELLCGYKQRDVVCGC